jgi:hypothetical protein
MFQLIHMLQEEVKRVKRSNHHWDLINHEEDT